MRHEDQYQFLSDLWEWACDNAWLLFAAGLLLAIGCRYLWGVVF